MEGPNLILGTMNFGPQADLETSRSMVDRFLESGYQELDSAYVYNDGQTEEILGGILSEPESRPRRVATKVHPRITGKLDKSAIRAQFEESLRRMRVESVDLLYLHFPDPATPLEETMDGLLELYKEGKFREFGVSNYPAWMVADLWRLCNERGWPKPTVYQGMYNGLTRNVESELFPALRKMGIRFYAFNPLAGGMLTGKHTSFDGAPQPGRFARLKSYRDRYWKESYFEAVRALTQACREAGAEPAEAAYRWLSRNSLLDAQAGDGIIVGASNLNQLEKNIAAASKGPLPDSVIEAFDVAWEAARRDCPPYFRFFTSL